jgi:hypothetical protein
MHIHSAYLAALAHSDPYYAQRVLRICIRMYLCMYVRMWGDVYLFAAARPRASVMAAYRAAIVCQCTCGSCEATATQLSRNCCYQWLLSLEAIAE